MNVTISKIVTIETEFDSRLLGERFQYEFIKGTVGNLEKFKKKIIVDVFFFFFFFKNYQLSIIYNVLSAKRNDLLCEFSEMSSKSSNRYIDSRWLDDLVSETSLWCTNF